MWYRHEKCGGKMAEKDGLFVWRGRYFKGLVCEACKSLFSHPDDDFNDLVGLSPSDGYKRIEGEPPRTTEQLVVGDTAKLRGKP